MSGDMRMNTGIWNEKWKEYRWPFLCAMLCGLLAFLYFFTNKLPNFDDVASTFSKGAALVSGRWGLEICKYIFPNYSMPWLWGVVSLFIMSISACLILDLFHFKSKWICCLLAGLVVVFPSQLSIFMYMFTSTSYALAFFAAVFSAWILCNGRKIWKYLFAGTLFVVSIGIYQANIAITATLFVLIMISDIYRNEKSIREVIAFGLKCVLFIILAVAVYYGITLLLLHLRGESFCGYAKEAIGNPESLLERVLSCFRSFAAVFVPNVQKYGLITSEFSAYMHIIAGICASLPTLIHMIKTKQWTRLAFLTFLIAIVLPLSITCMLLIVTKTSVHTIVMASFMLVYFLLAILLERNFTGNNRLFCVLEKGVYLCFSLIIASNIVEANRAALAAQFEYENTKALYTTVAAQIQNTDGFDTDTRIALIGEAPVSKVMQGFGLSNIVGVIGSDGALRNAWSRESFINNYLGYDFSFASEKEVNELKDSNEVKGMKSYPYYGYVQKINNMIVVKLS